MKKLILIPLVALSAYSQQSLTVTNKNEIAAVHRERDRQIRQECFNYLRACPDTNAVVNATAVLKAATPMRTIAPAINHQPTSATPK